MGAALLFAWRPRSLADEDRRRFERVAHAFAREIQAGGSHSLDGPGGLLRVWNRPGTDAGTVVHSGGRWAVALGNVTRQALEQLFAGDDEPVWEPPFALLSHRGDGVYALSIDAIGLQHLYHREDSSGCHWISSSSLALAALEPSRLSVDGLAEWLAVGHFLSARTLVEGVSKLGCGAEVHFDRNGFRQDSRRSPRPGETSGSTAADERSDAAERYARVTAAAVSAAHDGSKIAMELTGGLDTRLVLAAELSAGRRPASWTIGNAGSAEVRTARRLASRFGLEHWVVDLETDFCRQVPDLILKTHRLSDGEVSALEYAPLMLALEGGASRREVSLSGGGGEVARGFYYSVLGAAGPRVRGVPVEALRRYVSRHASVEGDLRPDVLADPTRPAGDVIEAFVGDSPWQDAATILDDFYLRTRMQRFAGPNKTTTGLIYMHAAPFFSRDIVDLAFELPVEWKRNGLVVRSAIRVLAPELLREPLDNGSRVLSPSWRRPLSQVVHGWALGRRGLDRYGGAVGRAIARRPPGSVPWEAVAAAEPFRELVGDLLLSGEPRVEEFVRPDALRRRVEEALDGGDLYRMGLLLTVELTLQALAEIPTR